MESDLPVLFGQVNTCEGTESESSPIQQVNNVCLGNVFATLMEIQPAMSFIFFS